MDNEDGIRGNPGICLNDEDDDEGSDEGDWSDVDEEPNNDNKDQNNEGDNVNEEDEDDDEESDESNESENDGSDGGSSDASDGTSEKCAICLHRFTNQEIGTPETCEHHFCLTCITEWSKKVATCPVDRKTFPAILVKQVLFGPVLRIVDVEVGNGTEQQAYEEYDTDPTYCEICGNCDREDRLLLCDDCDLGYHLECLEPPMEYIPIEDWYCPTCQIQRLPQETDEAGPSQTISATASRPSRRQLRLPRTGLGRRIVESLSRQMSSGEPTSSGENSRSTKRTTRKRTKSSKPRKTTKKRGKRKSTKGSRGRKRKKGRSRVAIQRRPATARARIAHQLGIVPPRKGQVYVGLPRCRAQSTQSSSQTSNTSSIHNLRYQAGITPLRIYSTSEDLADCIESFSDEEIGRGEVESGSGVIIARAPPVNRIGLPFKPSALTTTTRSRVIDVQTTYQSSSSDILGPILNNQIIMLTDRNIQIKRDGTLVPSITPSSNLPSSTPSSSRQQQSPTKFPSNSNSTVANNNDQNSIKSPRRNNSPSNLPSRNSSFPYPETSRNRSTINNNSIMRTMINGGGSGIRQVPNSNESATSTTTTTTTTNNNTSTPGTSTTNDNNNVGGNTSSSSDLKDGNNTRSENNNFDWNNSNSVGQNILPNHEDPNTTPYLNNNKNDQSSTTKPNTTTTTTGQNKTSQQKKRETTDGNAEEDDEYNIYSDIEEDAPEETQLIEKEDSSSTKLPNEPAIEEDEEEGSERNMKERDRDSDSDMVIDDRVGVAAGNERESRRSIDSHPSSEQLEQQQNIEQSSIENINSESNNTNIINNVISTTQTFETTCIPSPTSIPLPDSTPPYGSDDDDDEYDGSKICDLNISSPSSPEPDSEDENEKNNINSKNKNKQEEYDPSQPLTSSDEEEHSIKLTQSNEPTTQKVKKLTKVLPKSTKSSASASATTSSTSSKQQKQQQQTPTKEHHVIQKKIEEKVESNLSSSDASEVNIDLSSIPMPSDDYKRPPPIQNPTIRFSIPSRHKLLPISSLIKRQKGVMRKENKSGSTLSFSSEISKAFGEEKGEDSENESSQMESQHENRVSLVAEIFGDDDDDEEEEEAISTGGGGGVSDKSKNMQSSTDSLIDKTDPSGNSLTSPSGTASITLATSSIINNSAISENNININLTANNEQIQSSLTTATINTTSIPLSLPTTDSTRWKVVESENVTNNMTTTTTTTGSLPAAIIINNNKENEGQDKLHKDKDGSDNDVQPSSHNVSAGGGGDESDDSISFLETIKVSRREHRRPFPSHRRPPLPSSTTTMDNDDDIIVVKDLTTSGTSQNRENRERDSRPGARDKAKDDRSSGSAGTTDKNRRSRRTGEKSQLLESISEEDTEFGRGKDVSPSLRGDKRKSRKDHRGDRSRDKSRDKSREKSRDKSRDKIKEKEKEREVLKDKSSKITNLTSKRKRSASPLSNWEEGEIVDSPEKRRKRKKEKKKGKKRRKSKDSKSSSRIDFSEKKITDALLGSGPNLSDEDNNNDNNNTTTTTATMGENLVSWRKPSTSTKERNYRDGKPKPEEKYFKVKDKKQDQSPHDRRDKHLKEKTPPSREKIKVTKHDTKKSRRRSISPFGRRSFSRSPRSRSRSFSKAQRRFNSNRSNRSSSSNKSFRSRSRSRSVRRKYGRLSSISPRRSRSRSPLRLRSRSPIKRSGHNRKKSPNRPRRRVRARSISRSRSSSGSPKQRDKKRRKDKEKEKGPVSEKVKKRREKEREKNHETRVETKEQQQQQQEKEKDKKKRKKRREKSVSPAKAIFADGDSIVVSLSFQNKGNTNSSSTNSATTTTNTTATSATNSNTTAMTDTANDENEGYTPPHRLDFEGDKVKKSGRSKRHGRSSDDKDEHGKTRLFKKTLLIDLESSPIQEQNIGVSPTLIVLSDDEEGGGGGNSGGDSSAKGGGDVESNNVLNKEINNSNNNNNSSGSNKESGNITTNYDGKVGLDSNSPYRHVVPADSTHSNPHQNDSNSPYESNTNLSPSTTTAAAITTITTATRGDSLVTSTRDSEIGLKNRDDFNSRSPSPSSPLPSTPPPLPTTTATPPLPAKGNTPPLPNTPPSYMSSISNNNNNNDTTSRNNHMMNSNNSDDKNSIGAPLPSTTINPPLPSHISNGQGINMPSLAGKPPMGIGNIPGLFPSSISSNSTGNIIPPPPLVIPAPPNLQSQMRFPPSVSQNILPSNVLASVAALLARQQQVQQQQQQQQSSMLNNNINNNNKFSNSSQMGNAIGNKQQVLLPKNQNSHRSKIGGGDSPFSPNSSDGDDLFEPPLDSSGKGDKLGGSSQGSSNTPLTAGNLGGGGGGKPRDKNILFDSLFGTPTKKSAGAAGHHHKTHDKSSKSSKSHHKSKSKRGAKKEIVKLSEGELRLTEDVPTSAVELRVKEKFLKKLNRQERVVEEVKLALKPHYSKKHVTKDEYKEILRRAVPKICHNKTGEINPFKIKELVEAYVKKFRHGRKKD